MKVKPDGRKELISIAGQIWGRGVSSDTLTCSKELCSLDALTGAQKNSKVEENISANL